jgi:hypothetical protein
MIKDLLERCNDIILHGCSEWERLCISNEIKEESERLCISNEIKEESERFKMNREKKILNDCLRFIKFVNSTNNEELELRIKSELENPELPLTDEEIWEKLNSNPDYNCYEYVNGYIDGIKFAENHHGITS